MLAAAFRKNLFQTLDQASKGGAVMIECQGKSFRLEAVGSGLKLAGAVKWRAIVGDPDLPIGSDIDVLEGLDAKWSVENSTY